MTTVLQHYTDNCVLTPQTFENIKKKNSHNKPEEGAKYIHLKFLKQQI